MNVTKIGHQNFCSINKYNNTSTVSYTANNQKENKSQNQVIFTFILIGAIFVGLLLSAKGKKI